MWTCLEALILRFTSYEKRIHRGMQGDDHYGGQMSDLGSSQHQAGTHVTDKSRSLRAATGPAECVLDESMHFRTYLAGYKHQS